MTPTCPRCNILVPFPRCPQCGWVPTTQARQQGKAFPYWIVPLVILLTILVFFFVQWKQPSRYDEIIARHSKSLVFLDYKAGTPFSEIEGTFASAPRSTYEDSRNRIFFVWGVKPNHEFAARFEQQKLVDAFELLYYPGTDQPMIVGFPVWTGKPTRVFDNDGTELKP